MNSKRLVFYQVDEELLGREEMDRRMQQLRRSLLLQPAAVQPLTWPVRLMARLRRAVGLR
jgi:hypothetical protein